MKVLIVDPDWQFSRRAAGWLEQMANLVIHEADTRRAVDLSRRWQPEMVIIAAEYVEAGLLGTLSAVLDGPIVLITEHMDRYDRAWRAWQMGGHELLLKPVFSRSDLRTAVVAAIESAVSGLRGPRIAESA